MRLNVPDPPKKPLRPIKRYVQKQKINMPITPIEVLDTAIKIGLGSLITAVSGYFVLKKTHSNERYKEKINRYYNSQEERKNKYIEFIAQSQSITQKYIETSCNCQEDDYINYIRIFSEVQIISDNQMRVAAYKVYTAVNEYIVFNSSNDHDLSLKMRKSVNDAVGQFFAVAQVNVSKELKNENEGQCKFIVNINNKIRNIIG